MSMIRPCLWFDGCAEEAAAFYVSVFPNSRGVSVTRSPADNPSTRAGEVLFVSFEIDCADQAEVDRFWKALVEGGGEHGPCGWLKDRFGVSWQVAPRQIGDYLAGPDPEGNRRAMEALLAMGKLDIDALRRAYAGAAD